MIIFFKKLKELLLRYALAGIICIAFLIRTYVWHFSNWVGLVHHGDGYLYLAQALANGNWDKYLSHWRFMQPVYPLYLVPIYYFNLSDSVFIFWLHQSFVAATIILLYLSVRNFFGKSCALAASWVYAIQLQIAYWINWTLSDMAFHFHLSLFLYLGLSCWNRINKKSLLLTSLAASLLVMTRPDGLFIVVSYSVVLLSKSLTKRFKPIFALGISSGLVLICSGILIGFIYFNEKSRVAILSNIHVGWGLYTGTLPTPTNPAAVDKDLIALFREGSHLSKIDPQGRNQWYWASQIGLERIKNDPLGVIGIMMKRYIAVIIPSSFRDNPSWRYVLIDRFFSFYLIIGILLAVLLKNERRHLSLALLATAFSIYTLVTIYQREWDVRVQLSSYILLLGPSSWGWSLLYDKFFLGKRNSTTTLSNL